MGRAFHDPPSPPVQTRPWHLGVAGPAQAYDHVMSRGSLAIVEKWQEAVNAADLTRVQQLPAEHVEVAGPRGRGYIERHELAAWIVRSGFTATPLRWFCGCEGAVVVEQEARWIDNATGVEQGRAVVASQFLVDGGFVSRVARHDDLVLALDAAGLTAASEVTTRG